MNFNQPQACCWLLLMKNYIFTACGSAKARASIVLSENENENAFRKIAICPSATINRQCRSVFRVVKNCVLREPPEKDERKWAPLIIP